MYKTRSSLIYKNGSFIAEAPISITLDVTLQKPLQYDLFPDYFISKSVTFNCDMPAYHAVAFDVVLAALNSIHLDCPKKLQETIARAQVTEKEIHDMARKFQEIHKVTLSKLVFAMGLKHRIDRIV